MTKAEHTALMAQLQAVVPVEQQNLLLTLASDYDGMLNTESQNTTKINELTEQNTQYRNVNNSLWLKITTETKENGTQPNIIEMAKTGTEQPKTDVNEKLTYENFIKEES